MATSSPAAVVVLAGLDDLRAEQEDLYRRGDIRRAPGVPYTYWCNGGAYQRAERAGRVAR